MNKDKFDAELVRQTEPVYLYRSCIKEKRFYLFFHFFFSFNNQPTRRTNYLNLFSYKTLHVSGIFSAHYKEFSTVHSALVSFM
jgi:hypothetical protein